MSRVVLDFRSSLIRLDVVPRDISMRKALDSYWDNIRRGKAVKRHIVSNLAWTLQRTIDSGTVVSSISLSVALQNYWELQWNH